MMWEGVMAGLAVAAVNGSIHPAKSGGRGGAQRPRGFRFWVGWDLVLG